MTYSVGSSNHLLCEHGRTPVLAHDETSSRKSNEHSNDHEISGILNNTRAGTRDGCKAQDDRKEDATAVPIESRSEDPEYVLAQLHGR